MKSLGLKEKQHKNEKYHSYKGQVGKVADNLLNRDFSADKPYEKLTTNVTQFNVCNEKVYLSPVMDLFNREIISHSVSLHSDLRQVREILSGLFKKLPACARPIFHSDQGCNTNTQNINGCLKNIILRRVCHEKETVWITVQRKTFLAD